MDRKVATVYSSDAATCFIGVDFGENIIVEFS